MNIESVLKKEGITVLEQLDTLQVNTIAKSISNKLCLAFPEHALSRSDLFSSFSRIDMYIADMGYDNAGAKYYYKNNSIYFNKNMNMDDLSDIAIHECLHFIQEIRDENNEVVRMGLYDTVSGLGLNEATVQLMAAEASMIDPIQEKYFNITLNTPSPDYYPIECALVKQISYFTGTYPLFHSTLNSNDVFKNTFITKTDKKTYRVIIKNLDRLLQAENELQMFTSELQYAESPNTIKLLNRLCQQKRDSIVSLFFRTQNIIIKKLFANEFNSIRSLEDIRIFQEKLYDFKDLIGYNDNYTFYNDFYINMMDLLDKKREHIEKFGEINLFEQVDSGLMIVDNTKNTFAFLITFIKKTKKLFRYNTAGSVNVNEL